MEVPKPQQTVLTAPLSHAIHSDALAALPPPAYTGPPPAIVTDEPAPWKAEDSPYFADLSTPDSHQDAAIAVQGPFPALGPIAEPVSEVPAELAAPDADPEADCPFHLHEQFPAFVTSAVTHAVLLIALAMWIITQDHAPTLELLAEWSPTNHATLETTPFEIKLESPTFDPSLQPESSVVEPAPFEPAPAGFEVQAPEAVEDVRGITPSAAPVKGTAGKPSGYDGRGEGQRQRLLREGGSAESESAVALGLKWLKEHQYPDGGWRFDHSRCPNCKGQCDDPGRHDSTTGATALALLPFLGAGQTHQQGKYQEVVRKGLYFLMKQQEGKGNEAGDFRGEDGDMYCHGLASTALCEAYGMTRDKMLMVPAQKSLDFIVAAQDQRGGGWRYQPNQKGDTSIVGWQVMALKSGHMAYLKVPKATITKAAAYLDSVESESGAFYGYTNPGRGTAATSAIGLLCRMHMGWSKEHPGIVRGVQELTAEAPSRGNMYFNYYATQVLRQYGGAPWTQWNNIMREQLINTQVKNGHEEGSWAGRDTHLNEGGRLYVTALSIMTLEVYYRHMPLYKEDAVKNDFRP